jgi:uncharacterized protein
VSLHRRPWTTDGPESNLYGLEPNFGCCTANYHQGWPKFAASLWMWGPDDGLVAALYAPSEVRTMVRGNPVHLVEETDYPFRDTVRVTVNPASAMSFPLRFRVPAWANNPGFSLNGQLVDVTPDGGFAKIERTWKTGDVVELKLPMQPAAVTGFHDSVSIERGPLIYSLPIGESWVKLRDRGMTADWQVFPSSQWNYALASLGVDRAKISVEESPVGKSPFSLAETPVKLKLEARKIPTWRAVDGVADPVPQSPVSSSEASETIQLVPYGAAKLRITAFPQLKS